MGAFRKSLERIGVPLLLVFGLWRMVGTFALGGVDWNWPVRFLAFSPNPSPFLTVRSTAPTGQPSFRFLCKKRSDGSVLESIWGPEMRARIPGPQRVVGFYGGLLNNFSDAATRPKAEGLLILALCQDSALAIAAGCGANTQAVTIEQQHTRGFGASRLNRSSGSCP
jgi:hypothetical protein